MQLKARLYQPKDTEREKENDLEEERRKKKRNGWRFEKSAKSPKKKPDRRGNQKRIGWIEVGLYF